MLVFFSLFSSLACWETSPPGKCNLLFQTMQSQLLIHLFTFFPIPFPTSLKVIEVCAFSCENEAIGKTSLVLCTCKYIQDIINPVY